MAALEQYNIEACHPDDFIINVSEIDLVAVLRGVNLARTSLKRPPLDVLEYLGILEKYGLTNTVSLLRQYVSVL